MPSGPKKRKSAKRKNKASISPPHQGWLRSHMQMLKAPSFGNGTKEKEKHNIFEKEAVGNGDIKKGEEKILFEFKGGEVSDAREMDVSGNAGTRFSAMATEGVLSEGENSQKVDDLKIWAFDKSAEELLEAENSEWAGSNGISEDSVTGDTKVNWSCGLEEKDRECKDVKEVEVDNSLEEVITSQEKVSDSVNEDGEAGQAEAGKAEVILAHEVNVLTCEKEEKAMVGADRSMEAPQDDEMDAITPEIEIPQPPMVVRRASVWNCCGLLEVFMSSHQ